MSQTDLNVHEQIKQYVNEISNLKDKFDHSHDLNEKKKYLDAIRDLHGKTRSLVLKHEIDRINDFQKDYKLISKNNCLISYMELCIRKCEKKLRSNGQEGTSDEIFIPQEGSKKYTLRPKNDMYELSLNLPTETTTAPIKKNGVRYDSPSSTKYLDELRTTNSATSDDELSVIGFAEKRGRPIQTGGDETLSGQVNGVQTTEGNNLVDEYLRNLKDLMHHNNPTLSDQINNLETTEANELVDEYDKGLKGIKASMYDVKKPTLLRIWASWCGPSRESTPAWKEFEKSSTIPGLQIVDLDVGNDPIKQNLAKSLNVMGFPTILLFKDGKIFKCNERSVDGIQLFCKEHLKK